MSESHRSFIQEHPVSTVLLGLATTAGILSAANVAVDLVNNNTEKAAVNEFYLVIDGLAMATAIEFSGPTDVPNLSKPFAEQ